MTLDELEKLCEEATPGPFECLPVTDVDRFEDEGSRVFGHVRSVPVFDEEAQQVTRRGAPLNYCANPDCADYITVMFNKADGDLLVAARTALPELVKDMREVLATLHECCQACTIAAMRKKWGVE